MIARLSALFGPAKIDEKKYEAEARAWDHDWRERVEASRRNAWVVAGCAAGTSVSLAIAIVAMMPLKRVDTYLVRVDNATGVVEPATLVTNAKTTYEEALVKRDLWRYVLCRESYLRAMLMRQYNECAMLSGPDQAQHELIAYFDYQNPKGPYARYGEQGIVEIEAKSIAFVSQNVAQVRFRRIEKLASAERPLTSAWIATIEYQYAGPSPQESIRLFNPLGFQVVRYRLDPETVQEEAPKPPPASDAK